MISVSNLTESRPWSLKNIKSYLVNRIKVVFFPLRQLN